MAFFSDNFPKINYDFTLRGIKTEITDIFRYVDVVDRINNSPFAYRLHDILDGERPDNTSMRLYGTPDYYWTFFIANDFLKDGLNAWPKGQFELREFIRNSFKDLGVINIPHNTANPMGSLIGSNVNDLLQDTNPAKLYLTFQVANILNIIKIVKWDSTQMQLWVDKRRQYSINTLATPLSQMLSIIESGDDLLITMPDDSDTDTNPELFGLVPISNNSIFLNWQDSTPTQIFGILDLAGHNLLALTPEAHYAWDDASLAPDYYQNSIGGTTSAYTALGQPPVRTQQFVSYAQALEDLNDSRSKIRIIRPELISKFASTFRDLVNK